MEVRAVCFDFDGTLVDSESIHLRLWNEVLQPYGVSVTVDEFKHRYLGCVAPEMAADLVKKYRIRVNPAKLSSDKDKRYAEWVQRNGLPMLPYAREAVAAFSRRFMKMACVTGSPRKIVIQTLGRLGLLMDFTIVVARDDVARSKPDPECYLKAMKSLGESVDAGISFEDSEAGVLAATGAGMICYGIAWESSTAHDLSEATKIFNNLREATLWVVENHIVGKKSPTNSFQ